MSKFMWAMGILGIIMFVVGEMVSLTYLTTILSLPGLFSVTWVMGGVMAAMSIGVYIGRHSTTEEDKK